MLAIRWPTLSGDVSSLGFRGRRIKVHPSRERRGAPTLVDRHRAKTVVVSRFGLARTLTPVLAGDARMDRRRFLVHNVVGATAWPS